MPDQHTLFARHIGILQSIQEQDRRKRERLSEAVKAAGVPLPDEIIQEIAWLAWPHDREVLREHPGFSTWEKLKSYEASLRVFERSVEDLLSHIQRFEQLSRDGTIFKRVRESELSDIRWAIQKELFAVANAAHALVEHSTRRLQKAIEIPGFKKRLSDCFGRDGLHDFVVGLRRTIHHFQMIPPEWHVKFGRSKDEYRATFKLNKNTLSSVIEGDKELMGAEGRKYLNNAPRDIDLRQIFDEYRHRAMTFHSWYPDAIAQHSLDDVMDYERCVQEIKKIKTRIQWRAMLLNWLQWDQPPNPYDHLDRYLTRGQLHKVLRLPMQSHEQVDQIIAFVDVDLACDDEIRHLAYDLFRRARL